MFFVVERYLPGLDRDALLASLERLDQVTADLRMEGTRVVYRGSTIVLQDDACLCRFEADSVAAVAAANTRAGLPVDRIVPALAHPAHAADPEATTFS